MKSSVSAPNGSKMDHNQSTYTYDARGNFDQVIRKHDNATIDNLQYIQISNNDNQVGRIAESSATDEGYQKDNDDLYVYDANGNMTYDPQKGITIQYNHLDLPDLITWDDGREIRVQYDADGTVHRRQVLDKNGTEIRRHEYLGQLEYLDGYKYAIHHSEGRIVNQGIKNYLNYLYLDHLQTDDGLFEAQVIESTGHINNEFTDYEASQCIALVEGFEVENGATFLAHIEPAPTYAEDWQYEWDITDHLGNLRVTYSDLDGSGSIDPSSERLQLLDYYPYGMRREHTEATALINPYQYNGIDHVNEFGLDWNMATYRSLDPGIGQWGQVDPKAELQYNMSPYCAMNGNPISNADPDGDLPFLAIVGIGAATGIFGNGLSNASQGQGFFDGALQAGAWGAVGAAASFGIGSAAGSLFGEGLSFGKAAFQFGAHGVSSGLQSSIQGGNFGQGFLSGSISSGIGSGIEGLGGHAGHQIIGGGLGGGIGSSISGGNFFEGMTQGLLVGGFNHALHSGLSGGPGDPPTKEEQKISAYELYASGEISQQQYLNAVTLIDNGSWALVKQVLFNNRGDIALSVVPGGRLVKSGMSYKKIAKILKKNGWTFVRNGKGSHRIWQSPGGNRMPIPDHGSKSISRGIINQINKID